MKAVVWEKYGDSSGLTYKEVEKPVAKENEVLIKIHATTVSRGDTEMRGLQFSWLLKGMIRAYMGLLKPRHKILGQELAGTIEAVGQGVEDYRVGDQVIASTGFLFGTYAEYITIKPKSEMVTMVKKPQGLSMDAAAALAVSGMEAYHYLSLAGLKKGDHICINGAGGSFGTFAIQLAKYYGAEVTAVDARDKWDVLRQLGADHCLDYRGDSYYNEVGLYDVIFDIVAKSNFRRSIRCLKTEGTYVFATPKTHYKLQAFLTPLGKKRVLFDLSKPSNKRLKQVLALVQEAPIHIYIDRVMSLEEVAKAHTYIEQGLKKGNLVIRISEEEEGIKPL